MPLQTLLERRSQSSSFRSAFRGEARRLEGHCNQLHLLETTRTVIHSFPPHETDKLISLNGVDNVNSAFLRLFLETVSQDGRLGVGWSAINHSGSIVEENNILFEDRVDTLPATLKVLEEAVVALEARNVIAQNVHAERIVVIFF